VFHLGPASLHTSFSVNSEIKYTRMLLKCILETG